MIDRHCNLRTGDKAASNLYISELKIYSNPIRCCHMAQCPRKCCEECIFHSPDEGNKLCYRGCIHDKCMRQCNEACSHVRCDQPCTKQLKCGLCKKVLIIDSLVFICIQGITINFCVDDVDLN